MIMHEREETCLCIIEWACALLHSLSLLFFFRSFLLHFTINSTVHDAFSLSVQTCSYVLIGRAWAICSAFDQVKVKAFFCSPNDTVACLSSSSLTSSKLLRTSNDFSWWWWWLFFVVSRSIDVSVREPKRISCTMKGVRRRQRRVICICHLPGWQAEKSMQLIFIDDDHLSRRAIERNVERVVGFISRETKHKV